MEKIDLHIHSINSDGFYTTKKLLKLCEENNLKTISITDHDSVQSYFDIKNENLSFNGKIIIGAEFSFLKDGRLFDVLAYNFDLKKVSSWINKKYNQKECLKNQQDILNDIFTLYKKLGVKFDDSIKVSTGKKSEAYNLVKNSVIGCEENKTKFPEFWEDNFYKKDHTNINSKYYVNETRLSPSLEEVVELVHSAGGITSLAHSGVYGFSEKEMRDFLEYALSCGVDGLELQHSLHKPEDEDIIKSYSQKVSFFSAGSDYHGGLVKPKVKLGKAYNKNNMYYEYYPEFFKIINKNQKII